MPDIKTIEKTLNYIATNPNDPIAKQAQEKMKIGDDAIKSWRYTMDNPDDPIRPKVRNKVFDRVAFGLPEKEQTFGDRFSAGPLGFNDRTVIKNLLDRDPILQQKALEKQGYITRVKDGEVQVKKPGEPQFQKIEFDGIDVFDATDVITDVMAGGLSGITATLGGILGAPAGPAGVGAGIVAGGGVGAGIAETVKQGIAKDLGLRDEFDVSRIGQETVIGGLASVAAPVASKLVSGSGKLIQKAGPKLRENVAQVREAAKRLGIKPALRQIYDDDTVRLLEENLEKNLGTLPGVFTRSRAKATVGKLDEIADAMIGRAKNLDLVDVGQEAKTRIQQSVKRRLAPVEAIYKKVEGFLKGADEFIDEDYLAGQVDAIADKYRFDPGSESTLNFFKRKVGEINNLSDLKTFRTNIGKAIQDAKASNDIAKIRALGDLYDAATTTRSRSLNLMIDNSDDATSMLAQAAKDALKQADEQYRNINKAVSEALLKRGQVAKQSAKAIAENLENITEMKLAKTLLDTNDPKKLQKFKEVFPDAFEVLREGKIAEVAKAATNNKNNTLRIGTIMDRFAKMPRASKELIFGKDVDQTIKDLQVLFESLPPPLNPSGTSHNLLSAKAWGQALISNLSALGQSGRLKVLTNTAELGRFLQNTAEQLGDTKTTAIVNRALREYMPTQAEFLTKDNDLNFGIPNRNFNFGVP